MNTNFKVIGLTRLGIKPKSTDSEADVLRPSELWMQPTGLYLAYDPCGLSLFPAYANFLNVYGEIMDIRL